MNLALPFRTGTRYVITQDFAEHAAVKIAKKLANYNGGIDYYFNDRPIGTDIQAATGGSIIFAGWDPARKTDGTPGGYGLHVRIKHADGTVTIYAHLSEVTVVAGQIVGQGGVIGRSGNTGNSSGPHLHFEVRNAAGVAVDPAGLLKGGSTSSPTDIEESVSGGLPKAGEVWRPAGDYVNDRLKPLDTAVDVGDTTGPVTLTRDAVMDKAGNIWGPHRIEIEVWSCIRYKGNWLMKKVEN